MPADISKASGAPEIAYVGDKPWHGLGTKIEKDATMEEVIEAAGLGWTVGIRPVFQRLQDNKMREVEEAQLIIREDTQDVLGVTGRRFKPLQNVEAFAAMDKHIKGLKARYDVAGALGKGENVWALAYLGKFAVGKDDEIIKYLLLANSHDGKHSLRILITTIRVVCANTMVAALDAATGRGFSGVHSSLLNGKLDASISGVLEVEGIYRDLEAAYGRMLTYRMSKEQTEQYFRKVFKIAAGDAQDKDKPSRVLADLNERLGSKENTLGGMAGTLWATYNSATEFCDHGGRRTPLDTRAHSLLFGPAAGTKQRAFEEAIALIK